MTTPRRNRQRQAPRQRPPSRLLQGAPTAGQRGSTQSERYTSFPQAGSQDTPFEVEIGSLNLVARSLRREEAILDHGAVARFAAQVLRRRIKSAPVPKKSGDLRRLARVTIRPSRGIIALRMLNYGYWQNEGFRHWISGKFITKNLGFLDRVMNATRREVSAEIRKRLRRAGRIN